MGVVRADDLDPVDTRGAYDLLKRDVVVLGEDVDVFAATHEHHRDRDGLEPLP